MKQPSQACESWEIPELLEYVLGATWRQNHAIVGFFVESPGLPIAQTEVQQLLFMREASNGDPVYHRCIARLKILFDAYVERTKHPEPPAADVTPTKRKRAAAASKSKKSATGKPASNINDSLAASTVGVGGYAAQMIAAARRLQGLGPPERDRNDLTGIEESEPLPLVEELWGLEFDFNLKAAFRGQPPCPESCRKRAAELLAFKRRYSQDNPRALAILDRLDAEFAENAREYTKRLLKSGAVRPPGGRSAP